MATARHRGRAKANHPPGGAPPEPHPTHESTPSPAFPFDIAEMIIAYFTHDLTVLKMCSLICRSWYYAAVPHLHHTLTLKGGRPNTGRSRLEPLSKLDELGLVPLFKEIRIDQGPGLSYWFLPRAFNHHFSALTNVHTLKLDNLEIYRFIPEIERYFGHFSKSLRSIGLYDPYCTPRQLSHFLSLFSNLDDIEVRVAYARIHNPTVPDTGLVPFSTPKLRGRLVLSGGSSWVETWTHLITSCGGLRFRHMDLDGSPRCAPVLLKACSGSLETLRFDARDTSLKDPVLSRLKALRSLQIKGWVTSLYPPDHSTVVVKQVFSAIVSPVLSEVVIVISTRHLPQEATLFEVLHKMNEVRPFKLVFLLEAEDPWSARPKLAEALNSAAAKGLLDFLDSPPTIRTAQPRHYKWDFLDFN